jgi:hypothetical protein
LTYDFDNDSNHLTISFAFNLRNLKDYPTILGITSSTTADPDVLQVNCQPLGETSNFLQIVVGTMASTVSNLSSQVWYMLAITIDNESLL